MAWTNEISLVKHLSVIAAIFFSHGGNVAIFLNGFHPRSDLSPTEEHFENVLHVHWTIGAHFCALHCRLAHLRRQRDEEHTSATGSYNMEDVEMEQRDLQRLNSGLVLEVSSVACKSCGAGHRTCVATLKVSTLKDEQRCFQTISVWFRRLTSLRKHTLKHTLKHASKLTTKQTPKHTLKDTSKLSSISSTGLSSVFVRQTSANLPRT